MQDTASAPVRLRSAALEKCLTISSMWRKDLFVVIMSANSR